MLSVRSLLPCLVLGLAAVAPTPTLFAAEPPVVLVWPQGAPGSEGRTDEAKVRVTEQGDHVVSNIHRPTLTVYLPAPGTATGAGIVVMPGGGHRELWTHHEGHHVARWLSERGIAAFILFYRLAREEGSTYTVEGHALADAQRAVQLVRHRAKEWGVDPARLGVMGFSAGGQVAALNAMKGAPGDASASDPLSRQSSLPTFQVLVYPGRSGEILPAAGAPPAFLVCGENDRPDISQGLAEVYLRFRAAGVSAELHIYSGAGHGFGVRPGQKGAVAHWPDRMLEWLGDRGLLTAAKAP